MNGTDLCFRNILLGFTRVLDGLVERHPDPSYTLPVNATAAACEIIESV